MPVDLLLELEKVRNQGLLFSRYPRVKGRDHVSNRTAGEVPGSQFEQTVGVIRDYLLNHHHDLLRKAVTDRDMRNELKIVIEQVVIERELGFGGYSRALLVERLLHVLAGFGPLEPLLEDPTVDDILVNGVDAVYVERSGRLESTSVKFRSDRDILQVIQRIVSRVGRKINESSPLVDAKLPDGSRVTCAIPPACLNGPILAIRKHRRVTFSSDEYISLGSASPEMMKFLEACVRGKLNIIVSGGTGSGKTTILRVLASYIPPGERLITIEDTGELRLSHPHVLALEATREITVYDLLVNALRMRPDRILLGEVRDREAFTLLEAMSTGHQGSLTTIHANGPTFETLQRLTRLMLREKFDIPQDELIRYVSHTVDLIVYVRRFGDGSRRITRMVEVIPVDRYSEPEYRDLYLFRASGMHAGMVTGVFQKTGDLSTARAEQILAAGRIGPGSGMGQR